MERILVPVDGSENAARAVEHVVAAIRKGRPAEIHLLNVQPALRENVTRFVSKEAVTGYHRDEGVKALVSAKARLDAAGLPYESHIGVGGAGETIAEFAETLGCDEIVMGTRGLGGLGGLLLGSVATEVIRLAKVPVTLVK